MTLKVEDKVQVRDWSLATEEELEEGYREMAADEEREREAEAWSEALIGDGLEKG